MLSKPLKGIRVVDMSIYGAGPCAGRVMADWGADVIKVEQLGGEVNRYIDGNLNIPKENGTGPVWELWHANKRVINLNVKTPQGRELLERLIASADVFNSNMRLRALEKMGITEPEINMEIPVEMTLINGEQIRQTFRLSGYYSGCHIDVNFC